jgi:hypothetical protein
MTTYQRQVREGRVDAMHHPALRSSVNSTGVWKQGDQSPQSIVWGVETERPIAPVNSMGTMYIYTPETAISPGVFALISHANILQYRKTTLQ